MRKIKIKMEYLVYILAVVQSFLLITCINIDNNRENNEVDTIEVKKMLSYKDLDEDLSSNKNIRIIELNKNGNSWSGIVGIEGSYKEIEESINKLKLYEIIDYSIEGEEGFFQIILKICI